MFLPSNHILNLFILSNAIPNSYSFTTNNIPNKPLKNTALSLSNNADNNNDVEVSSRRTMLQKSMMAGLTALTAPLLATTTSPTPASAAMSDKPTPLYFGTGCFWHIQHEFVEAERAILGRKDVELTSRTGYAGGTKVDGKGRVCYHNLQGAGDYGRMGHGEVVGMTIPENKIEDFAKVYFSLFDAKTGDRVDPGDRGGEYRYLLGLPGGDTHPAFPLIAKAASSGGKRLVAGKGNDPDTFGKGIVYYYDTTKFPFYVAERYHQFHNDFQSPAYGKQYNSLSDQTFVGSNGANLVEETGCPEGFF